MISPGEIAVGMVLTILEWEPYVQEGDGIFTMTRTVQQDHSWEGELMEVTAVQLPYVVVIERRSKWLIPITLDTRRVKLMELSDEFIKAKDRKDQ
jgi:hypothetical protein